MAASQAENVNGVLHSIQILVRHSIKTRLGVSCLAGLAPETEELQSNGNSFEFSQSRERTLNLFSRILSG